MGCFIGLLLFMLLNIVSANFRVFGWYNGNPTPEDLPWEYYTHIRYGSPIMLEDGTALCNQTQMNNIVTMAQSKNTKIFWAPGDVSPVNTPEKYWKTIGSAVKDCRVDGIGVDYEHGPNTIGVVTPTISTQYTKWLAKLRKVSAVPVAADISIWGVSPGNYILGLFPWVNVSMLNAGAFDFVNTMSYHWNSQGDIWAWKKDIWFLVNLWGIHPSRINLGIGYYSKNHKNGVLSEPSWGSLSTKCPNIGYKTNVCDGVVFVGKKMNYDIGVLIKEKGLGGAFPWELSYDSYKNNNTLVKHLVNGLSSQ